MTLILWAVGWLVVSIPIAIAYGKFLAVARR